jgi:tetratricopeptide (TPR) repeat protein
MSTTTRSVPAEPVPEAQGGAARAAAVLGAILVSALAAVASVLSAALWVAPERLARAWPAFSPASVAAANAALPMEVLRAAIALEPSNARLVSRLAAATRESGDQAQAVALTESAARLSHYDTLSHFWLFVRALDADDGPEAVERLDTILRTDPASAAALMASAGLRRWPGSFMTALAGALAKQPHWRPVVIDWLFRNEPDLNVGIRFANLLAKSEGPVATAELPLLLMRLMNAGRTPEAHALWAQSLSADRAALAGLIFDPRFETEPQGGPFEWTPSADPGVSYFAAADQEVPGRAAVLDVLPGNRPGWLLSQVVMLPPGKWRFVAHVRLQGVDAARGLRWSIACVGGSVLGSHAPVTGIMPWRPVGFDFEVPKEGCAGQLLQFAVLAPTAADAKFGGSIRLADLTVTALP